MLRQYTIDEKTFSNWSPNIAYVLGFIYADGHLQDVPNIRAQYLRITSIDKDRLIFIREVLNSTHPIVKIPKKYSHYRDAFLLSIGSKALYSDLIRIGLHPAKSMNMTMPSIPNQYFRHFLRGYFDGDGCLYIERKKLADGSHKAQRLSIVFTSGSREFLEQLGCSLLFFKCIDTTKIYKNGRSFQMRFSTKEAIRICKFMYHKSLPPAYMKRKREIYWEYTHP